MEEERQRKIDEKNEKERLDEEIEEDRTMSEELYIYDKIAHDILTATTPLPISKPLSALPTDQEIFCYLVSQ